MNIQNPEELPDEEWALQIRILQQIRKEEAKINGVKFIEEPIKAPTE